MGIIRRWSHGVVHFLRLVSNMVVMDWQAQPRCFIGLLGATLVLGLVPLATAWVMKAFFDLLSQAVFQRALSDLPQQLVLLVITQAGLLMLSQGISLLNQYFHVELGRQLSLKMKANIYQKLNSFIGLRYFEDPKLHNTIQRAANGAQLGPLQFIMTVTTLIQGIVTLVAFLGVLIAFNPLLAAVVAGVAPLQMYVQLRFSHQRFGVVVNNTQKERRATYYGQVLSWAAFAKEVRLFNLGDYFLTAFLQTTREIYRTQQAQQKREFRWQLSLSFLANIIAAGAFALVIRQALAGHVSLGDVSLYLSAVTSIQSTLLSMTFAFSQVDQGTRFYREYIQLLALPQPIAMSISPPSVPPLAIGITFHDVSFRYSEEHPWVLRHLNLFFPARTCLALVGLNGAGKTTLAKLLTRLYDPTEGQILWDGIDLREFDPQELRSHMGAIFQDFARYDLTVQDNIGLGNVAQLEKSSAIQQAAIRAGIHERIATLPQGYQSFLGRWLAENDFAVELSGGEWQKIALARMFMREAEVLILDEPTASLDAQAEYALYTHFRDLMCGRTSLLITHRFSTVRMADAIAVIEDGHITEYGTHDELVSCGGTYARLYAMQAEQYK
jgi:ATP-binding cassette subfamily B protein